MQTNPELTDTIRTLPKKPGIYKFYNKEGKLIYVGKAKELKTRVKNYFTKSIEHNRKTQHLISQIDRIEFAIVETELEALLLENNLIKKNQPKYNILLKDDKSYPYICITKERFPRLITTRQKETKGEYFGPYTNHKTLNDIFSLLQKTTPLRTCTYNLSADNVKNKKYKRCLEYDIGNCKAPCEELQSEQNYNQDIDNIRKVLNGKLTIVKENYKQQIEQAIINLDFERSHEIKQKLDDLSKYQSKNIIVNDKELTVDIITITDNARKAFINYTYSNHGIITISETITIIKKLNETNEDLIKIALIDFRQRFNSQSKLILTNISIHSDDIPLPVETPSIGTKKRLVQLSYKNVLEKKHQNEILETQNPHKALLELKQKLQLQELPRNIECFDNSNLQGTNPVASMASFIDGKPKKSNYRHYKIKTVVGPDDFASMTEIVERRYTRLLKEDKELPNLIVIDGGKGQVSAAVKALKKLNIEDKVNIIGIAKQLEEIYKPYDSTPLHINKRSVALKIIQQARNEAHRFAITFHKNQRSRNNLQSIMQDVNGIGRKTIETLLSKYKSINKIYKEDKTELERLIGKMKTKLILEKIKKESQI